MGGNKIKKLPEGWRWETLDKISTNIQYGISKSSASDKVGPNLLRITDIQDGKVDWDNVPFCECSSTDEERYILENDDIVFARTGATTGKSFLVNNPEYALFASYLIRVQCDRKVVDPNYLYVFFKSPTYWNYITQGARGGTLAGFNATMLSKIEIPLPPTIDDQIRIASELERKMAEVETMRQTALRQKEAVAAIQGAILREVFPYKEGDELPEGWRWASLGNVSLKISKGTTPTTLGHNFLSVGVPFLRAEDVVGGAVDPSKVVFHISKQTHDYLSRSQLKVGDLLITIAGTLGRVGYVPKNSSSLNCNQAVAFVRLKPDTIDPRYACFVCQNTSFYNSLIGLKATSTISNLNLEQIKEAKIPLPATLDDQIKIAGELECKMTELDKMRQAAEQQLEAVESLPGAILREVFDFEEDN